MPPAWWHLTHFSARIGWRSVENDGTAGPVGPEHAATARHIGKRSIRMAAQTPRCLWAVTGHGTAQLTEASARSRTSAWEPALRAYPRHPARRVGLSLAGAVLLSD